MNGIEPKVEIFKPFGEAVELTKKILFEPFDLRKWCVIGFAAFLARLGGGFNFNFNFNQRSDLRQTPGFQDVVGAINQIPHWVLVLALITLIFLILAICVVFAWLRARGRFIFIDCIVRNRGAIVEPWRNFRREANSYFLFSLLVGCAILVVLMLMALPFMLPIVRGATFLHMHDVYLISMIVLWAVVFFLLVIGWVVIAHFMVALMYRRRCRAVEAFQITLSLIANYPGEITLYCLFWIVMVIAGALIGCIATCATCCLTILPYVGTVILLPIFVCLRAFSLLFLRQFGPEYDVWETFSGPESVVSPPPLPA